MMNFLLGVFSSIIATGVIVFFGKFLWPNFKDRCLYHGVRVTGSWDVYEVRNGEDVKSGKIELKQQGRLINGTSIRTKTRDGRDSERKFNYSGSISGHQMTLIFDDLQGKNFDTGTYVFIVQNDSKTMIGMTTFHGKTENKIVAEYRVLKKTAC
ncbi:hypothetical protein ACMGG9_15355 [Serratia sp. BNK-10]|uniref:hypothetical protein n=1 Tax=Serratia sp. BNK-10 TaxID=3376147 RepID=UPI0039BFC5DC